MTNVGPDADRDRRGPLPQPRDDRAAGVDAVVGHGERRVGDEVGGREAERAPALVAVCDDPAHPERRAEQPRRLGDRAGRDQRRGCASRRRSRRRPRPAPRPASRTRPGRPAAPRRPARGGRSGSSRRPRPAVAPSRPTSSWSMKSCAVCAMRSPSNGITISSSTPSAAIRSAFCSSVVSSFGADCGATTVRGCGSNVSTLSAPRITSRWPACTPSNSPTARRRGRGVASGSQIVSSSAAEAYDGLEGGAVAWLGERDQAVRVAQADNAVRVAGDGDAVGRAARRRRPSSSTTGRNDERVVERRRSAPRRRPRRRRRRSRVRRSSTQYASPRSAISERT